MSHACGSKTHLQLFRRVQAALLPLAAPRRDRGERFGEIARSRPRWSNARSKRAKRRHRRHGPSPSAHGWGRPCPTSRPNRPKAQRPQGRRRSARSPLSSPGNGKEDGVGQPFGILAENFRIGREVNDDLFDPVALRSALRRCRQDCAVPLAPRRRSRRSRQGFPCRRDGPFPGRRRVTSGAGIIRSALATMAPAPFGPPILCDDRMR